jgi:transcriptional regulator with XRE-family HTH domain
MGKRRSADEVEALVREFEASGLTRQEFSQRAGIAVTTLDAWRRKRTEQAKLVKVEVSGTETSWPFSLSLRNGRRIESAWSFADADLARLIRIAESA